MTTQFDINEYREELKEEVHRMNGYPLTVCEGKNPGVPMGEKWQLKNLPKEEAERLIDNTAHPAIGIILGPKSVIDFDIDGPDELQAFMDLFDNEPPIMPFYDSGREGGEHRFAVCDPRLETLNTATVTYKTPDGKYSLTIRIGCKHEENGTLSGSQSIIPPSRHAKKISEKPEIWEWTGKRYQWREGCSLDDIDPPRLPDSVIEKIVAAANKDRKPDSAPDAKEKPATPGDIESCIQSMLRIRVKREEQDSSKRLLAYACRCIGYNLTDGQAIEAIRHVEGKRPFLKVYSDADITRRLRDAEHRQERGQFAGGGLPKITVSTNEKKVNDRAVEALARLENVYQRGGFLVHVAKNVAPPSNVDRDKDAPRIEIIPQPVLRELLTEAAQWQKWSADGEFTRRYWTCKTVGIASPIFSMPIGKNVLWRGRSVAFRVSSQTCT